MDRSERSLNLTRSDQEIEEMVDVEAGPRAMGAAEDVRGLLFEEIESKVTSAKGDLEEASDRLSEVMKAVEDLDGEHEGLRGKVLDAFDALEDGQMAVDEAKGRCGRQFESLVLEDRLALWAACHKRFPDLVDTIEQQRDAIIHCEAKIETLQGRNRSLKKKKDAAEAKVSRLKSQNDALGPLL
jgi:chromosome segregation ATPase